MPKDFKFKFPDVTSKTERDKKSEKDAESEVEQAKSQFRKNTKGARRGIPTFFGL